MALALTTLGQTPLPTISAATNISTESATLNGTVNANYLSTIVSFEYGITTSYGSAITATQNPITGSTNTNVSASITGLTAGGTTYHARIKATNSLGTTYSNDITFTTLGLVPSVTTLAATNITTIGAQLNGSVNANYLSTVVTFEYGTTISYSSIITASQSPVTGNATTSVTAILSGLIPNTVYHFRVKTINSLGTSYGNDLTFTSLGQAPTATTQAVSIITATTSNLNGIVNANYLSTAVTFEYGTTINYDNSISAIQSPMNGNLTTSVNANLLGLSPTTTYHYRVKAVNALGTAYGNDMSFTTMGNAPTVITQAATNILPYSATLNGSVNANFLSTTVTLEYGITTSYGSTVIATQSPIIGSSNTNVSAQITGLTEGTVYHYRIIAINILGTTYGNDITFNSAGLAPTVTTLGATSTTPTSAQLNGSVNANYLASSITFEYGTTTSYDNAVIATQSPITGNTNINVSIPITGLLYNTTYHYRVKAVNSLGTTFGSDMTFVTVYTIGEYVNGGLVFYIDGTGHMG